MVRVALEPLGLRLETSPRGLVCVVGAQEQFANYILRPASMDHARIVNVNCDAEEMNAFKLAD